MILESLKKAVQQLAMVLALSIRYDLLECMFVFVGMLVGPHVHQLFGRSRSQLAEPEVVAESPPVGRDEVGFGQFEATNQEISEATRSLTEWTLKVEARRIQQ